MKPGRDDPCPCGSGRKFKHCHGATAALPHVSGPDAATALAIAAAGLRAGRLDAARPGSIACSAPIPAIPTRCCCARGLRSDSGTTSSPSRS
ncbi:MAG: SEC-C domain-containing protein [Betaproteobacteria bacterium]|nr:SEC-C domain-containing protein [Betaproteobacteria bacterium]